ncbi:glycosyltransferase family 4 protein [Fluviicola taffensis]|uniref:Glycosyl transferase group 1 n=1 Tax=Fluviicola taffensis (strain DSM 16823 / NCIMB 13979 / RW262) TaxID=755732 RepID=F2I9Z7_FLUTR|nr:glycosyltransferase family 4 protein [Fluviicola taffensis]AEA44155.1 glycosyl transferase group 1 [Fluviicola taffensis DSM 16823]
MKICYFAFGESYHTIRWCNHFSSLGYEVHLITFAHVSKDDYPNIHLHIVNSGNVKVSGGNWHLLTHFRKIKRLVRQINPDIFHALYATSYGVTGALVGHENYIITALGSDLLVSVRNSFLYKKAIQFAFRKAKWITVMSPEMRDVAQEIGTNMSKVSIVPFGINPDVFNSNSRALMADEFVITSTRNLEQIYNIPHLLNALALIKDKVPNLRVNIMGSGSLQEKLEDLNTKLNLSKQVTFWGKVNQFQIAETLNQSHVFVSVSQSDGNNISLNEAMACGAFCIATDIPANRQWIQDGENGFLVQINDVEGLANRILEVYSNYETLQGKAIPFNKKIIEEKGIWTKNMKVIEQKYLEMINH